MQGRHLFILLAFALFASPLAAQETTGKIQGRVVDAQSLAVPGATVTATGVQGSKNTVTDTRAATPFRSSRPASTRCAPNCRASRPSSRRTSPSASARRPKCPSSSRSAAWRKSVQVTGAARVVDTSSTTIGAVMNTDDLKPIPVGRTFSATMYLTAGRQQLRYARRREPVDLRRLRPREPVRRWTARTSRTPATAASGRTRSRSVRWATRRRTISSRKSRSRPAATRPSSARRPAAS